MFFFLVLDQGIAICLRLKRILVGMSSRLPYTHFFWVSTGVCFQNWWVDAQIIGTPR
jgi:hypothetical protein